jgi:acyl carrier protein
MLTRVELHQKVVKIIADKLGVMTDTVTPTATLRHDLAADSLDQVELIMAFEEAFDIDIADEVADEIETVDDIEEWLVRYVGVLPPPPVAKVLKVGDRVKYILGDFTFVEKGECGRVCHILPAWPATATLGVEWDISRGIRHTCQNTCSSAHGWYVVPTCVELTAEPKCAREPAVGDTVQLIAEYTLGASIGRPCIGEIGKVVRGKYTNAARVSDLISVEWRAHHPARHTCDGFAKDNHGWNVPISIVKVVRSAQPKKALAPKMRIEAVTSYVLRGTDGSAIAGFSTRAKAEAFMKGC